MSLTKLKCAFDAALLGAVIGVVLVNFAAGLVALNSAGCIKQEPHRQSVFRLLGLGLITTVKKPWQDVTSWAAICSNT